LSLISLCGLHMLIWEKNTLRTCIKPGFHRTRLNLLVWYPSVDEIVLSSVVFFFFISVYKLECMYTVMLFANMFDHIIIVRHLIM